MGPLERVDMFKTTKGFGVNNKIMDRLTLGSLKIGSLIYWILDVIRNNFKFSVDLYFTELGLLLDYLTNELLVWIIHNITHFKLLVVWVSS